MQEKDENSSTVGKPPYCCSNPNCRNVFSIPKVIKYYVCPICQTLVEMTSTDGKAADEQYAPVEEPQSKKIVAKPVQSQAPAIRTIEPKTIEPKTIEPKTIEPKTIEPNVVEPKVVEPKVVEPKVEEPKAIEPKPQSQMPKSLGQEEKENHPSDQVCKYYLGYLSQRDKGEGIPETCVECNKSLDCMLSEYYKSEKTVSEIKKWYHPKF
jgi:type IV secretory pathway VirB10-like protein